MAIMVRILRDSDSLEDAIGAFGLIGLVFMGCFAGEAFGLWGQ